MLIESWKSVSQRTTKSYLYPFCMTMLSVPLASGQDHSVMVAVELLASAELVELAPVAAAASEDVDQVVDHVEPGLVLVHALELPASRATPV